MRFIKLEAITAKAAAKLDQYGDVWKVIHEINNPDPVFFQTRKPQLYIVPAPRTTRNPKENLGDNYVPPSDPASIGAMYINVTNDPDYEYKDTVFKQRRAA